jgi:carbonic anhydrase
MSTVDEMLEVAESRSGDLAVPEMSSKPRRRVAILTCMDVRIDLFSMFGLRRGDAHIIRNAGGLVTDDAVRSLSISQHLLGTDEIIVIMHDGCGLHHASEEGFVELLAARGEQPPWKMGAFDDTEATLSQGIALLRSSPYLRVRDAIRGIIFNPDTGRTREV